MEQIFINNKKLISELNQLAMAYTPALSIDREIDLLTKTYYSTVMSILHFGEGELNFRKGERYETLNLAPEIVRYSKSELNDWNKRGISAIDNAIITINEFINSGTLNCNTVSGLEGAVGFIAALAWTLC